jgi:uncharacterized membrane protein
MNLFMVVLRLIHIGAGVFWAGGAIIVARFVIPSLQDAGPEGGKVAQALQQRGLMTALPAAAVLTILSGLILYWRVSGGYAAQWSRTPTGMALGLGAAASIVAFAVGISVMRPAMMKAGALAQTLPQLTDPGARDAGQAEIQRLRRRGARAGNWVAGLVGIAVAAMAVARYL